MIIGLSGYAKVGKDTLYDVALKPLGYKRLAFADALKREIAKGFNVSVTDIEAKKDEWRSLLVAWGERRRHLDPEYWINKVAAQIDPRANYCITDVRYANEAVWLQELGASIVLINRPGYTAANKVEAETIRDILTSIRSLAFVYNIGSKKDLLEYQGMWKWTA